LLQISGGIVPLPNVLSDIGGARVVSQRRIFPCAGFVVQQIGGDPKKIVFAVLLRDFSWRSSLQKAKISLLQD
jgi:hypothetical protein